MFNQATCKVERNSEKPVVDEASAIRKMSAASIFGNAALSAFKLAAGVLGNSSAMVSDAVHSFSDVATTLVAWIGVKVSRKEADEGHPYGHDRAESLASLGLGAVLLVVGLGIGKSGIDSIVSGSYANAAVPGAIALVAAAVSIAVKEAMYWYTRHYAKLIDSPAFMADAWHHRSDAFSSVGALVGIGGSMLGFPIMDPLASVVICVFIVKVSVDIVKDATSRLLDSSCGEDFERRIAERVRSVEGVRSVDMVRTRRFGSGACIDLEISVDGSLSLSEAHGISERARAAASGDGSEGRNVTVHVNPASGQVRLAGPRAV